MIELLNYLLDTLRDNSSTPTLSRDEFLAFLNYRNHSGNTPLHWAALNTHLDCVKILVEAGADISAKNDAGHDAAFLAERADWSNMPDVYANTAEEDLEKLAKEKWHRRRCGTAGRAAAAAGATAAAVQGQTSC